MDADEEEVAYSVEDTNFRLCEIAGLSAPPPALLSAQWDRNDRDTLYLSHGNGQLRVFNTVANASLCYQVHFKQLQVPHLAGPDSSALVREVNSHWDKFATIPTKPGHVLFLLGISRQLYHATLPPSFAASARESIQDTFIFGKPVTQLWSHSCRIVSLAVSYDGRLVVTGDERGRVKAVLMSRVDPFINPTYSKAVVADSNLGLTKFNAHAGSVYCVSWLTSAPKPPISSSRARSYAMVTGSSDHLLKVWSIDVDGEGRIEVALRQAVSTLSSHILCLSSASTGGDGLVLAAGTNLGSVFVWTVGGSAEADQTALALHSLLHVGRYPVAQVAVSSAEGALFLAASDTVGFVRTLRGASALAAEEGAVRLVNEASYEASVAACCFQPARPKPPSPSDKDPPPSAPLLLVCTVTGPLRLYSHDVFTTSIASLAPASLVPASLAPSQPSTDSSAEEEEPRAAPPLPLRHSSSSDSAQRAASGLSDDSSDSLADRTADRASPLEPSAAVTADASPTGPARASRPVLARPPPAEAHSDSTASTASETSKCEEVAQSVYPTAFLAQPSVHSSEALRVLASRLIESAGDDDGSVTSMSTTLSEKKYVANKVVSERRLQSERYDRLLSVSEGAVIANTPSRPALHKQVDAEWLFRRQHMGPSERDARVFEAAPPCVRVRLQLGALASGLRVGACKDEHRPCFGYGLSARDVYGDVDSVAEGGLRDGEERYAAAVADVMGGVGESWRLLA